MPSADKVADLLRKCDVSNDGELQLGEFTQFFKVVRLLQATAFECLEWALM